MTFPVISLLPT
ncbi:rCG25169, partial [Rattus norvegicus]